MAATSRIQKPVPLGPSGNGILSEDQWRTFAAIADAVIPSITPSLAPGTPAQRISLQEFDAAKAAIRGAVAYDQQQSAIEDAYLAERVVANPAFKDAFLRFVKFHSDSSTVSLLSLILNLLGTRAGCLVLTGYATPIADLTLEQRQGVLKKWGESYIPVFRTLHRSFTLLPVLTWIRTSETLSKVLTYPVTPIKHEYGNGFPFEFMQFTKPMNKTDVQTIETDYIVVGSGCAGGVVSSVLAQAGSRVIVVDKAYYWAPEYLPMTELQGFTNLFQNGGITSADSQTFNILSGSCWGGGGTVNWSASLQLQHAVRQEWARLSGVPYFTSAAFQSDLDAVCERMGVGTAQIEHNFTNQTLLEGARKLGMAGKAVPQNTAGEAHNCGYCTLGCGSCGKKGPTETWLPDAAKSGANFIEGFAAEKVLFDDKKRAIGVRGTWSSRGSDGFPNTPGAFQRRIIIKATKGVISTSGALGTPVLLKRSGLKSSHIGAHLHLHPVSVVGGVFDQVTKPWDGGILTSVVTDLENQDGQHHGVKLEAITMIPGLYVPNFPYTDPLTNKVWTAKMSHSVGYISLARDSSEGLVYVDPKDPNRPRVIYEVNTSDRQHIARGIEALAKILYVQGAREIRAGVPGIPIFVRTQAAPVIGAPGLDTARTPDQVSLTAGDTEAAGINDPAFNEWLTKYIHPLIAKGHPKGDTMFGSAHQMGSARMGSSAATSACDPRGQVWGTKGLYVADTCAFPAASGVNPMITAMALARGIARGIVRNDGIAAVGAAAQARL